MDIAQAQASSSVEEETRKIARIPVRNIWLLLLYASSLYKDLMNSKRVAIEENPDDIPNLIAEILAHQVELRLRRSLNFGSQTRQRVITRVRGRILHLRTEQNQYLQRGKVVCQFNEFTVNTARNRFVRAALESISAIVGDRQLAHRCRSLALRLFRMGVTGERPSRSEISIDRFGRNDKNDQLMVVAAQLTFNLALPTEEFGSKLLSSTDRYEKFWKIYENGIAGFYDTVLSPEKWNVVPGKPIKWQKKYQSSGIENILPSMKTDIVLNNPDVSRRIVIDTKSNAIFTRGQYRENSLRSGYIYQIYAYLRSQEDPSDSHSMNATGLLLHPAVDDDIDEAVVIQGHEIRFSTVNLMGTAIEIRERLLEVVDEYPKNKYMAVS